MGLCYIINEGRYNCFLNHPVRIRYEERHRDRTGERKGKAKSSANSQGAERPAEERLSSRLYSPDKGRGIQVE